MAAAWTACTKLLFAEKSGTPEQAVLLRGFAVFAGFFEGGLGKSGCKWVVFCGEVVVICVVERASWMVGFCGLEFATFLKDFCGKL